MSIIDSYKNQLNQDPGQGNRNAHLLGIASNSVRAGRSEAQAAEEIANAWKVPPYEVEHAYRTAIAKGVRPLDNSTKGMCFRNRRPEPKEKSPYDWIDGSGFVRGLVKQGKGAKSYDLINESPIRIPSGGLEQTIAWLENMFRPEDSLFCGDETGREVKTRSQWVMEAERGSIGPIVSVNALTGGWGRTQSGTPSRRSADCVAKGSNRLLLEFDHLSLEDQTALWFELIRLGKLPILSLVYSGNKSIHGIIDLGTGDRKKGIETFQNLFANPHAPETDRVDVQCFTAIHTTRLAGARRPDTGRTQALLFLSPPPNPLPAIQRQRPESVQDGMREVSPGHWIAKGLDEKSLAQELKAGEEIREALENDE